MNRIRWGILGCGDVVRKRVAQAIQDEPRSELLAVCRRDVARLREFCTAFSVPGGYTSDTALLSDREIDAVYVATPVDQHLPQTLAAAAAGKHVLVEKPMALTVAECDRMIAACREQGLKLGVAYYRRFYRLVWRIKQILASGQIGQPLSVSAVTATPLATGVGHSGHPGPACDPAFERGAAGGGTGGRHSSERRPIRRQRTCAARWWPISPRPSWKTATRPSRGRKAAYVEVDGRQYSSMLNRFQYTELA